MTKSVNHQFLEFSEQVKKRYIKTRLEPLTGWRLNPRNAVNPNERMDFLLATPEENLDIVPYDTNGSGQPTQHKQVRFSYEDEVLELYTEFEVRAFERMNRLLIENGLLIEYDAEAPAINKANVLSDAEIIKIANLKTVTALKKRLAEITSIETLKTLLDKMQEIDTTTMAHVRAVKERINEFNQ